MLRTQNVCETKQKHFCVFVSATNIARAGKQGNSLWPRLSRLKNCKNCQSVANSKRINGNVRFGIGSLPERENKEVHVSEKFRIHMSLNFIICFQNIHRSKSTIEDVWLALSPGPPKKTTYIKVLYCNVL